jgi:hypothetical protein
MIFNKLSVRNKSKSRSTLVMMLLPLLVTAMLIFATSFQGVSAQNQSSANTSNNNNKTNLNTSGKTVVIPQGNKATIIANPTTAGQTKNTQGNNRTGFTSVSNLVVKDKTFPIKYNITKGKLLGIVGDKDKTTMIFLLGGTSDNGKLTVELPRNVLDAKGQGNTDTKYHVKIDNKDVDYKEVGTNLNARILQIDFSKDDRMMEIAGTQMAS